MEGTAYGAARAGGAFDLLTFLQQPHTVLRMVSWVSTRALLTIYPAAFVCVFYFVNQNNADGQRVKEVARSALAVFTHRMPSVAWCLIALKRQCIQGATSR